MTTDVTGFVACDCAVTEIGEVNRFAGPEVLARALPALRRAARPHAVLLVLTATPAESGVVGISTELGHLVAGGGTMTAADVRALLERSGWVEVNTKPSLGGVLALARCPG